MAGGAAQAPSVASILTSQRTLSGQLSDHHLPNTLQLQPSAQLLRQHSCQEEGVSTDSAADLSSPSGCCPPHGAKAVCGKRTAMEDAFAVQPDLLSVPLTQQLQQSPDLLPLRIAAKYKESGVEACCDCSNASSSSSSSSSSSTSSMSCTETFHFFGVYDGHGGAQAANHCAHRLHQHLSDVLSAILPAGGDSQPGGLPEGSGSYPDADGLSHVEGKVDAWICYGSNTNSQPCLEVDHSHSCTPESSEGGPSERADNLCFSKLFEEAMKQAFIKTDAEFATDECSALVGSTAVVALVGGTKYCIANCGDSRAVLYRGGKAMQLTDDHKPEREDEAERVEKAGGQVLYWNGHRVMGVLAMSRAIGDHMLRPYVIPEPEVTIVSRHAEDELLLLASDGLWDVMNNQEASSLAARCLKRAQERGASRKAAARIAASVLTRAAMDRGSKDNITVVIVDLQGMALEGDGSPTAGGHPCADGVAGSQGQQ